MNGPPDFSVIVPTFERPQALTQCLQALSALDPAGPTFEVIVVDDGSSMPLDAIVAGVSDRIPIRLLRLNHGGPAAARNAGMNAARGRWLAYTDDDCEPDPAWLSAFARHLQRDPTAAIGGRVVNRFDNVFCAAHQMLVDYASHHAQGGRVPSFFASSNLAMATATMRELGGFDVTFPYAAGEDRDLCARWRASGHPLSEASDAVVWHQHRLSLGPFCRVHHRYGRGARRFHRMDAQRSGSRVQFEPASFYVGLLLSPLSSGPLQRSPSLCAALALSQVCHALGYMRERFSETTLA